jgi:hypothetical protein
MSFLASPRRRRRLAWVAGVVACGGLIAAVVVLDPGRNTPVKRTQPTAPPFGLTTPEPAFTTTVSASEERDRERAEAAVRPLSGLFVNAMIHRTKFERAHALLTPQFQTSSVSDWQLGRRLPLTFGNGSSLGSTTIAYSGPTEVGLILAVNKPGDPDGALVAPTSGGLNGSSTMFTRAARRLGSMRPTTRPPGSCPDHIENRAGLG